MNLKTRLFILSTSAILLSVGIWALLTWNHHRIGEAGKQVEEATLMLSLTVSLQNHLRLYMSFQDELARKQWYISLNELLQMLEQTPQRTLDERTYARRMQSHALSLKPLFAIIENQVHRSTAPLGANALATSNNRIFTVLNNLQEETMQLAALADQSIRSFNQQSYYITSGLLAFTALLFTWIASRIAEGIGSSFNRLESTMQQELEQIAHYDQLTGLPNRLLFQDRLQKGIAHAERRSTSLAVIIVDLDSFKQVNETLGHETGDQVLKQAKERLSACIREEDTLARLSGDEFGVILEALDQPTHASIIAQKLINSIKQPIALPGKTLHLSASVGISLFPQDGVQGSLIIRNADTAMHKVKEKGGNGFNFYMETMTSEAIQRITLESNLHQAIQQDQLLLYYQPQVNLDTGQIIGCEALIRWIHPEQGIIPPNRFIPLAEETGLILVIGEIVIRKACQQARHWHDANVPFGRIAVNIAGRQISKTNLIDTLRAAMTQYRCRPEWLECEITENFVMDKPQESVRLLSQLKSLGISLAMDDFGTGQASLTYLKKLPLDILKIDQSFVRNLPADTDDLAICRAIIALGRSLDLTVIAEGVETPEHTRLLRLEGCHIAQGYHFSKPMPANEYRAFLLDWNST